MKAMKGPTTEGTNGPVAWAGIIAVTCLVLLVCQSILWLIVPVLFSVILYYVTRPLVNRLVRRGHTNTMAVNLVTAGTVIVLGGGSFWFFPAFATQVYALESSSGRYIDGGMHLIDTTVESVSRSVPMLAGVADDFDDRPWDQQLTSLAEQYLGDVMLEILHWVPSLLLVPYLTYFLLLEAGRFKRFLVRAIPNAYFEKTLLLFHRVDAQVQSYFQGLLWLTLLDAASFFFGMLILNFQQEMSISAIAYFALLLAMLSWVPYVGSIVGAVLLVLVAATDFPEQVWMGYGAIIMFLIVRMLDDFVYMPATVGRSLNVHPVVMVIMLLVGAEVAGITGLLLVMPVLGVVMVVGEILGAVLTDDRLRARQAHARALHKRRATEGLDVPV